MLEFAIYSDRFGYAFQKGKVKGKTVEASSQTTHTHSSLSLSLSLSLSPSLSINNSLLPLEVVHSQRLPCSGGPGPTQDTAPGPEQAPPQHPNLESQTQNTQTQKQTHTQTHKNKHKHKNKTHKQRLGVRSLKVGCECWCM